MRALLWLSLAAITALRLAILAGGPDLDTDAYGHAMVGRWMLNDPTDLRPHWVWLPLWNSVHALIAGAGGAMEEARLLNVALGVLPPLLLARLLRRATGDELLATTAGALLALWPLGVGLGQSAQPEPMFQALVLGACVAWHEERPGLAGSLLGAAALCRYEAWVLPPVYLALWWRQRSARGALVWVLPGLAIGAWCLVHGLLTGEALRFLRENREFARDALERLGFPWGREPRPWLQAIWYPLVMPAVDLRAFSPLALLGAAVALRRRAQRQLPPALLWPGAVILAFLSYGWVMRLNLGLPRHFYALAPLYAALTALGLLSTAQAVAARWPRARAWPLVPLAIVAFGATRTAPVALWNYHMHRAAFPSARASAAALRAAGLGPSDRVVCDRPEVELIARLPWRQVVRRGAGTLSASEAATLAPGGRLFVVAAPRDVAALRSGARVLREDGDEVVLVIEPG